MSTIAIGDIHGNVAALDDLLTQVVRGVSPTDTVVFLGDYIDRGPDTRACLDRIIAFRAAGVARVVTLLGNHEQWLLQTWRDFTRHSWLIGMEAFDTIESYSLEAAQLLRDAAEAAGPAMVMERLALPYQAFFECVPDEHVSFLSTLVPYHANGDGIFVHGGLDPLIAEVEDQPVSALVWGAAGFPRQYAGGQPVVYGHKNNAALDEKRWPHPNVEGMTIGIDTISHGVLTALVMPGRLTVQSRRHGPRQEAR